MTFLKLRSLRSGRRRIRSVEFRPNLQSLEGRVLLAGLTIAQENQLPGTPSSVWDLQGNPAGDQSIQGFATQISVNQGETVYFKINTPATQYHLDIYRMGYYQGDGARLVATVSVSLAQPQVQPGPLTDPTTGLQDYGTWGVSASWAVPADATSGIYFAKAIRDDTPVGQPQQASHIVFIVRDDTDHSDILFQTSDETWEAYNNYGDGGNSLYTSPTQPAGRAYAVSYNRPFDTRVVNPNSWVFGEEYPMVRWLESNGYDVSYATDWDTAFRGANLLDHKVFFRWGTTNTGRRSSGTTSRPPWTRG